MHSKRELEAHRDKLILGFTMHSVRAFKQIEPSLFCALQVFLQSTPCVHPKHTQIYIDYTLHCSECKSSVTAFRRWRLFSRSTRGVVVISKYAKGTSWHETRKKLLLPSAECNVSDVRDTCTTQLSGTRQERSWTNCARGKADQLQQTQIAQYNKVLCTTVCLRGGGFRSCCFMKTNTCICSIGLSANPGEGFNTSPRVCPNLFQPCSTLFYQFGASTPPYGHEMASLGPFEPFLGPMALLNDLKSKK